MILGLWLYWGFCCILHKLVEWTGRNTSLSVPLHVYPNRAEWLIWLDRVRHSLGYAWLAGWVAVTQSKNQAAWRFTLHSWAQAHWTHLSTSVSFIQEHSSIPLLLLHLPWVIKVHFENEKLRAVFNFPFCHDVMPRKVRIEHPQCWEVGKWGDQGNPEDINRLIVQK